MIKRLFLTSLVLSLLCLLSNNAYCSTEFVSTINTANEDYNTLALWEDAIDGDLTSANMLCGSWDSCSAGTCDSTNLTDGESVTWDSGSSTGTLYHITNGNDGSGGDQYMLLVTTGSLADNDEVTDGTNTFVVNGTPDGCIVVAEIFDDQGDLSGRTTIDGSTTDATHYLKITAPVGERHDGTTSTGAGIYIGSTWSYSYVITNSDNYTEISYLRLYATSTGGSGGGINNGGSTNGLFKNLFIYYASDRNAFNNGNGGTFTLRNSIITCQNTSKADGINVYGYIGGSGTIENVTVANCDNGLVSFQNTHTTKNVLANGNNTDYSGTYTDNTCISEDATSPTVALRSKTVTFKDEANLDFHLDATDTNAIDAGTDLSGTFTDDIDGDTRSGTWDIGADEYVSAATGRTRRMFIVQ